MPGKGIFFVSNAFSFSIRFFYCFCRESLRKSLKVRDFFRLFSLGVFCIVNVATCILSFAGVANS